MSDDRSRLARLETKVSDIQDSLKEMNEGAHEQSLKIDDLNDKLGQILVQTTKTNGRVNALEEHRNTVCRATVQQLESVKKRMWLFAGLMVGSGAAGGVAGAELLKLLVGG